MSKSQIQLPSDFTQTQGAQQNFGYTDAVSTRIKLIGIGVILVISILSGVIGYSIHALRTVDQNDAPSVPEIAQSEHTEAEANSGQTPVPDKTFMMEQDIPGGKLVASWVYDDYGLNISNGVFVVEYQSSELTHRVYSTLDAWHDVSDKVFAVIEDNILIVNEQTNKIDVYTYVPPQDTGYGTEENPHYSVSQLLYSESIEIPEDAFGTVMAIECTGNDCVIMTAGYQFGDTFNFNFITRKFTKVS